MSGKKADRTTGKGNNASKRHVWHSVRKAAARHHASGGKRDNTRRTAKAHMKRRGKPVKTRRTAESARIERASNEKELYRTDVKSVIEGIMTNSMAMEYLYKNVSKSAGEVISALDTPKTDEAIAEELDIKINTVRRILNIMYGYGITNYNVIKSTKGWLSFLWSVNLKKVNGFYDYISKAENNTFLITENTNDYFVCKDCYSGNRLVFDFDSAFEANFKCVICDSKLQRLSKDEARHVMETKSLDGIAQPVI